MNDIVSVGTQVFYRLGASIEHEKKFGTYPPKDFKKWAIICEHIIRHYNEGWADGFNHNIIYWEIWNEPDLVSRGNTPTWQGTKEQFVDLFAITQKHLKECFPNLKIGGPAMCSPWTDEWNEAIFTRFKKDNIPLDFFSFHGYTNNPYEYYDYIKKAKNDVIKYGFKNTEIILNEWNYIKGWLGDQWTYTLKSEKGLKGSSFIASTFCVGQNSELDMLMYYDARPCGMNGIFSDTFYEPLKGYYPFKMFGDMYLMGNCIESNTDDKTIYCTAGKGEKSVGVMISYFDDVDEAETKEIAVSFKNVPFSSTVKVYVLDSEHDMECTREEKFTSNEFTIYLKQELFTTYYIKIDQK